MRRFLNSLSGRFLALTLAFVMLAEVLILVPSIARFRVDYLQQRLDKAQIASLALLASADTIDADLETELLANAGGIGGALANARSALDVEAALAWILLSVIALISVEYGIVQPLRAEAEAWRDAAQPWGVRR